MWRHILDHIVYLCPIKRTQGYELRLQNTVLFHTRGGLDIVVDNTSAVQIQIQVKACNGVVITLPIPAISLDSVMENALVCYLCGLRHVRCDRVHVGVVRLKVSGFPWVLKHV